MIEGIQLASQALNNGMSNLSVTANNLANINTTGFKRDLPFAEMLDAEGQVYYEQYTDHQMGDIVYTNNPLDLALSGEGYFTVDNGQETLFTKNGEFKLSVDGFLVNSLGHKVLGQGGEINLGEYKLDDNQQIRITQEGEILVGKHSVDTLQIAKISDIRDLKKTEGSCFRLSAGSYESPEEGEFKVSQGYLESSNVNPIIEMEAMIQMSKDYEAATKMIQALDKSLEEANQIGKV